MSNDSPTSDRPPRRRPLRARRAARPRRHGRGPQGHRRPARTRRRGQAAAHRPGQRPHLPGPVPPRGAVRRLAEPPRDRRRSTTPARSRRPTAPTSPQPYIVMEYVAGRTLRDILREGRKILPERALEITSRRARRARLQPPRRHRAPRHQARQRDAHPERRREGDGLRHRPRDRRRLLDDDPDRGRGRHRAVPLPRAGPRRDRGLPQRRLLHRLPALRAAHRPAAVRRREPGVGGLPARARAGAAAVVHRRRPAARDRRDRDEGAGQAGRGPLPERGRDARGHRAVPRRQAGARAPVVPAGLATAFVRRPTEPPRSSPASATTSPRSEPQEALAAGAARPRRRRAAGRRPPSSARCCSSSAPETRTVPQVVEHDPAAGRARIDDGRADRRRRVARRRPRTCRRARSSPRTRTRSSTLPPGDRVDLTVSTGKPDVVGARTSSATTRTPPRQKLARRRAARKAGAEGVRRARRTP